MSVSEALRVGWLASLESGGNVASRHRSPATFGTRRCLSGCDGVRVRRHPAVARACEAPVAVLVLEIYDRCCSACHVTNVSTPYDKKWRVPGRGPDPFARERRATLTSEGIWLSLYECRNQINSKSLTRPSMIVRSLLLTSKRGAAGLSGVPA